MVRVEIWSTRLALGLWGAAVLGGDQWRRQPRIQDRAQTQSGEGRAWSGLTASGGRRPDVASARWPGGRRG
uniref:Uncharacterized protein n=1 Tax=Zea mays TaxID=4577 RepID=C4IZJ1_MAIZE|nr:unknown [Zea mays]ACR37357.1 unknown [Zea mays]